MTLPSEPHHSSKPDRNARSELTSSGKVPYGPVLPLVTDPSKFKASNFDWWTNDILEVSTQCPGSELMIALGNLIPISERGARKEANHVAAQIAAAFFHISNTQGEELMDSDRKEVVWKEHYFDNRPALVSSALKAPSIHATSCLLSWMSCL
jgi:hypothetical protein